MNYRHAFHAGNFADLVKHAALLQLLIASAADPAPLTVIDTHAGAGVYDLAGPEAQRSGEAAAGVGRLSEARDAPAEFAPLLAAMKRLNGGGPTRRYPGSPWLVADALRPQDRYIGCELRPSEHAALRKALLGRPDAEALCADGFALAAERSPGAGQVLVLIDPPFERGDDYVQVVRTVAAVRRKNAAARVLVWLPLKDLETFDAFLRDLEDAVDAPILAAETRMRPLDDPLRMNGCALVLVGDAGEAVDGLTRICGWTAETLGDGGAARIYRL
ncbi:MAG TPA: 23S rRNA (adenine(2030)-N(6))-methyltransferase RlmJ [Phenylobacterium sp.]|uniref:23S rRNA (adenine(2030)-N(6))-methyltransferase RlmJ n=1 Tax=Phenylobacterium sp. TaxID=1871053 RepID=UPI002B4A4199|nr:23S rRNA (adenine(2030)-N(6))-methyltransferase RlmJ [Phenylobacterium sp.]HKR87514.1 23S rRNA (adenine(2030)-N(6))-methyltransferase RlmJ [Phenylobacterium sp.]